MPGITGIYLKRKIADIDIKQLSLQMTKSITYGDWYKINNIVERKGAFGIVSLGILNPGIQPIFNNDNTIWIIMEGEIFNYDKLKIDLAKKGYNFKFNNNPEFILSLYEEYTDSFGYELRKLNGVFSIIIYDKRCDSLIICNDRYGFRPIYICDRGEYLLFSSEVKAILQDRSFRRNINLEAMVDFFSFGYILGDKTFFNNIKLLPPASLVRCCNDKISINNYWDWSEIKKIKVTGEKETEVINKLGKLWIQAVERNMKGKARKGLTLSGGLDSRAIASAISKKYYPIEVVTFGKKDCYDYKIAKQVCEVLGIKNHFLKITDEKWFLNLKKTVYVTEGNLSVIHQHSWDVIDIMKMYFDINLHGFLGEILSGSYLDKQFISIKDIQKYCEKLFFKMNKEGVLIRDQKHFFSDKMLSDDILLLSKESLEKEVRNSIKDPESNDYFFLDNRCRRFILMGIICTQLKLENRLPFSDNDFMNFVFSIPNKLRFNHYIYKKMLINTFPKTYSSIPWQRTGLSIGTNRLIEEIHHYYNGYKYKMSILLKKIGLSTFSGNNRSFVDYDNWMRNNNVIRNYINNMLLKGRILERKYFNENYIKQVIEDHMNNNRNNSKVIGLLLTFELFCRMFLDGDEL